ncbi:hypothetical protein [Pseudomonas auratipiscis]|uniref:Uncharacterized protein n=1 Tax=Pseudomonas auratipiscis TaxID=3115853 RepID=A0AB35WSR9_9PSED|nr:MULTISPECIES: hypothetical protein [unclassified Pseudomonas]MEE1867003.1 hypothetical protein [Pseudomonas sp. 120P]MEE1957830.1 hypothetical protein [Pseudomonas sp. 119P]
MNSLFSTIGAIFDVVLKLGGSALKCSIAIGSVCVIFYALRIGHFPKGLTLGDGLLFLLTAGCFGMVYALFSASLTSLGVAFSFPIKLACKAFIWIASLFNSEMKSVKLKLVNFHVMSLFFAMPAVAFIWAFGEKDPMAYLSLSCLSVLMYLLYSGVKAIEAEYRSLGRVLNSPIDTKEKEELVRMGRVGKLKNIYISLVCALIFTPLVTSGVTGQLADAAMRLAQVRVEKSEVYLKAPYSELLPSNLLEVKAKPVEGYKAFSGVVVEFQGFGNSTVITFKDGQSKRQVDVPNDHLIVEKDRK